MSKAIQYIIAIIVLLCLIAWYYAEGGWEPIVGIIGAIGTLLYLYFEKTPSDSSGVVPRKVVMKQEGGKQSTNYQAGGNINIGGDKDDNAKQEA